MHYIGALRVLALDVAVIAQLLCRITQFPSIGSVKLGHASKPRKHTKLCTPYVSDIETHRAFLVFCFSPRLMMQSITDMASVRDHVKWNRELQKLQVWFFFFFFSSLTCQALLEKMANPNLVSLRRRVSETELALAETKRLLALAEADSQTWV